MVNPASCISNLNRVGNTCRTKKIPKAESLEHLNEARRPSANGVSSPRGSELYWLVPQAYELADGSFSSGDT